jgi:DNA-binding transcriptional ArsR family regulator
VQTAVATIEDSEQIGALSHPVRARILESLRAPGTAAGLARQLGRSRQVVGYHLKELERVGLVRPAGERRKGSFIEQLYQATARRFLVSPRFAADPERLAALFRDQVALAQLSELGERVQRSAAELIEHAAESGDEIPSASVEAEVRFADESARAAFLSEYVESLKALLAKHGGAGRDDRAEGEVFRVAFAAYPEAPEETR